MSNSQYGLTPAVLETGKPPASQATHKCAVTSTLSFATMPCRATFSTINKSILAS